MLIDLNDKVFRAVHNSESGEVGGETRFYYQQRGQLVTATYSGGAIRLGQLIAIMLDDGSLDMRYHHLNQDNVMMCGECISMPEVLPDGRIQLRENWRWHSGDALSGESLLIELTS